MELVGNFFSIPLVFILFELAIWVLALNENDDPFVQLLYFCLRKKKRAHINIDFMLFYQRTDGATKHQMRLKSSSFYSANSYRFQWSTQPSSWSNGRLTLSPCDRFILPLILMPWGLCARNVKLNVNLGVWRGCGNATANGSSKIEISVKTPRSVVLPPPPLPPLPPSPLPSLLLLSIGLSLVIFSWSLG